MSSIEVTDRNFFPSEIKLQSFAVNDEPIPYLLCESVETRNH